MCISECNHMIAVNGFEAGDWSELWISGCEAVDVCEVEIGISTGNV